ncbi:MAG: type II secretion system secretin GspD [Pseudomonadales bacterium]
MNVRLCTISVAKMLLIASLFLQSFGLQAQDEDKITMNMRDADIRGVIQWVSDLTGKNILVHNDVQGAVTVISGGPVTKEEAYELFLSSLQLNGFAAIESNTVIKIVPERMAGQSATPLDAGGGNQIVTRIIPVSNLPANQLVVLLRPLLPENAKISADATSNSLVVVDRASNIARIQNIIQRMDKPGSGEFDLVKLKHANAADIMQSLSQLMPQQNGGDESGMLNVNFSYDERSNSILMFGDPAKRKNLRSLISRMDQPVTGEGSTQVVYLNYVDAEELVPILAGMAEAHAKDTGEDESKLNAMVSASKSTNALIINAPPALLASMKRVVSQVDIRRAQVLVEALVVEVNNDIANDIGVTWVTTNDASEGGTFGAVNTLGNLPLAAVSPSLGDAEVTDFIPGSGLTFGFFKNGSLRAALRALASNTKANILSTPTIIAMDNEEADLLVGQNVPFITGQSTGNASQTDNPFTTIERQDIGTSLKVTPRINRGDSIALQIEATTENIVPAADFASDIITNKSQLRTRALIKDDEVLVIGGLIREDETEVRQKVPLLGDIPLLGKLFSSKGITKSKNNLMVFIHPVILKDREHVADLTRKRYNFMRTKQKEISRDDWDRGQYKLQPLLPEFETFAPGGTAPIVPEPDASALEQEN